MDDKLNFTMADKKKILLDINESLQNPPSEVSINVILTGNGAKKFHLVKTLLTSSYPELDEDEIDKFIVRSGVEREIARLSNIWNDEE